MALDPDSPAPKPRARIDRRLAAGAIGLLVVAAVTRRFRLWSRLRGHSQQQVPPDPPLGPQETADQVEARRIRMEAFDDCAHGKRAFCQAKLDEAKQLDPAGESDPKVQEARSGIQKELQAQEGGQ